jgi:hypothetical protein
VPAFLVRTQYALAKLCSILRLPDETPLAKNDPGSRTRIQALQEGIMALPNLPYQLGKTFTVGNKQVHTRTIFSQRMSTNAQQLLQQCLNRADAALTYSINRSLARAPTVRNGTYALGPFNLQGTPTVSNFCNEFLNYFRADAAHPTLVADLMDTYRNACVSIQRGLQGALDIVDMPIMMQGGQSCGYVRNYRQGGTVVRRGSIHIDFGRITAANIGGVADTLIHEASHKFIAAKDHAYQHQMARWGVLTAQTAIENADSISKFTMFAINNNLQ